MADNTTKDTSAAGSQAGGERKVMCLKYKREMAGLAKPPFSGEIGTKIFNSISAQAWKEWQEMQIKVLNEYRLNMANPKDYQVLVDQMMKFLGLAEGGVLEVENAKRGGGA
jgi:Fe-S cluster biosynthesis and repair protein YggX